MICIIEHARKIKAVKGGKHYRWKVPFLKSGKMIHCESSIERDYVRILDFDVNVLNVIFQPIMIPYSYKGKLRKYYPDFKVITTEGDVWLVEVKSHDKLHRPENITKYIVGKLCCERKGWDYPVVTEKEIRRGHLQSNLSLLRAYGNQFVSFESLQFVQNAVYIFGDCSIKTLKGTCTQLDESDFYMALYSLIYHKKLFVDLISKKIDDTTIISAEFKIGGS